MPLGCFDIEMILKQFKRVFHKIQRLHYVQDDGAECNEVLEIRVRVRVRVSRTMKKYNISTAMKPYNTIRKELVHPKDKRDPLNTTHALYAVPCKNCDLSYIGETGRKFGTRLDEHRTEVEKTCQTVVTRASRKESLSVTHKSAITDHVVDSNHVIGWEESKVIGTEQDKYKRWIGEAIEIRKRGGATMN